jgi:uncharacterized protein YneF (UPF0154 family)
MEEQAQTSPILTLQLNVEQINAVLNALGKLPTETGVWHLMRAINEQATSQLVQYQSADSPPTE